LASFVWASGKESRMHAVVVAVSIESGHEDEALENLQSRVVPGVRQLPGVVAGYWLDPGGGQGYSTVVFETEGQAKAASETVRDRVPEFVTVNQVQVYPVVASI
jgi:hypothetical protein